MGETKVKGDKGKYKMHGDEVTLDLSDTDYSELEVVTKDLPEGLPAGYVWLFNFGIKKNGRFVDRITYALDAIDRADRRPWVVFYNNQVRPLKGRHTTGGDPAIGCGP